MVDDTTTGRSRSPEPLSGSALNARLFYLLVLLRRGEARMRRGGRAARGVMQGQGRVLRMLTLHSPIAQKDLSYLLGVRSQSLGEVLARLEEEGLVTRAANPDDRRTWMVEITDAGRRAGEEPSGLDDDPFQALSDEERAELARLLDKVIDHVESLFPGGVDRRLQHLRRVWFSVEGQSGWDMPRHPRGHSYRHFDIEEEE